MNRFLGVLVVAILLSSQAAQAAIHGQPDAPIASERVGTTVESVYQCDVMRDYYYNTETGQWVGWASDTYVTNCVAIGGSGGGGPDCAPGDLICLCQENSNHPMCRGGGGGGGPDCKAPMSLPGPNGTTITLYAAGDPDCPEDKPRKTCGECDKDRKAATKAAAANFNDCVRGWGMETAEASCANGFSRLNYDESIEDAYEGSGGTGKFCYPVPIGGVPICVWIPVVEECLIGWMYGDNAGGHTINDASTTNGTLGVKMGGGGNEITGSIGFSDVSGQTGSVTMAPATGLYDVCKRFKTAEDDKALNDYKDCSKTAYDGAGGSCSGSTPNGGGNTN